MMNEIKKVVLDSIETGEVLSIRYRGGSQPGAVRQISPISISGKDIRARCLATSLVKTFKLSKIEMAEGIVSSQYVSGLEKAQISSLFKGLEKHLEGLKVAGWVVEVSETDANLYSRFKNGKVKKVPEVNIQYKKFIYDYTEFDDEGNQNDIMKPSSKPWSVSSKVLASYSGFKNLKNAIDKFIEFANKAEQKLDLS